MSKEDAVRAERQQESQIKQQVRSAVVQYWLQCVSWCCRSLSGSSKSSSRSSNTSDQAQSSRTK